MVEIIKPDEKILELIRKVVAQNEKIIEINLRIVKVLSTPLLIVNKEGEKTND